MLNSLNFRFIANLVAIKQQFFKIYYKSCPSLSTFPTANIFIVFLRPKKKNLLYGYDPSRDILGF